MKVISRSGTMLAWVLAWALSPTSGWAQANRPAGPRDTVIEVRVEGNQYLSVSAVLANVKLRPGQAYTDQAVRDDEQRLLKTRKFERVEAVKTQTDRGVIVTFRVVERPVVDAVLFEGNKAFKDAELASTVPFSAGDPIDPYTIQSGVRAIESRYRAEGYYDAKVTYDPDALQAQRRVVFRVVEGPKASLQTVKFRGNQSYSARRLRGVIKSRPRMWPIAPGRLDLETVDRDVVDLRNFYRSEGYLDAEVDRELAFSPDKKDVVVTFLIEEKSRFRVRKLVFDGAKVFDANELRKDLKLVEGAFYDGLALRRDMDKIQNLYGQIGYINTRVNVTTPYADKPGLVDLIYSVDEGEQFRVGRVDIRGNAVTQERVIRRQLQFRPGQVFNTVAVEESRLRLSETWLFEKVEITPYGDKPGERDALVTLQERPTGQFIVGAGVSSNAGLLGTIAYAERNFDILAWPKSWDDVKAGRAFKGAGQTFRITAEPGTEFMRFHIDWLEPYLFDKPYSLGTRAFVFTSGRETYDETRYGGLVSLGHSFPNRWYGEVAGRIEGIRANDLDSSAPPDVVDIKGTTVLGGAKGTIVRDKTDSRWLPSTGDRISLSYEQVVGDFNFGRAVADYHTYYTVYTDALERKHILAARAAGGAIFGDSPVFERFYGGGLGSVRGFEYRGISPRQGPGRDPVGGDFMMFVGGEYSFPVVGQQLRGVVFLDSGTVERDFGITTYRVSAGFGLRLHVPFFGPVPMSLDFGFPISKHGDDDTQWLSFSFGWVF